MMDALERYHGQLLYSFNLNEAAPEDHLVREIAAILDLSCLHGELALQLHFSCDSESMCRHDPEVMNGGGIDRGNA